jgi:hypothetical protein
MSDQDDKTNPIEDPRDRLERERENAGPVEIPDEVRESPTPQERDEAADEARAEEEPTRVSVREEPPGGEGKDDEFKWHTGHQEPTGVQDAIEFVDVHKAFGRNKILRGLNMGTTTSCSTCARSSASSSRTARCSAR